MWSSCAIRQAPVGTAWRCALSPLRECGNRGRTRCASQFPQCVGTSAQSQCRCRPEAITTWVSPEGRESTRTTHKSRFVHTLEITPPGDASQSVAQNGRVHANHRAAEVSELGYGNVRGCYYGTLGRVDHKTITSESGEVFECDIDHFDAEKDVYPYADASFDTVLCCELIEHLFADPMHMMSEINRILKPGGHLVLTTPNIGSLRSVSAILLGYHPSFFPAYIRPRGDDEETEARHNREYVPMEVQHLRC